MLGHDLAAVLPELQAHAESAMGDTFIAYSPMAEPDVDADGQETPGYTPVGYTNGKIQGGSRQSRDTDARMVTIAGKSRPVVEGGLHIPLQSQAPAMGELGRGWEYVLISLGPRTPADLLNSRWLVVDAPAKSYQTARRLDVVRLT